MSNTDPDADKEQDRPLQNGNVTLNFVKNTLRMHFAVTDPPSAPTIRCLLPLLIELVVFYFNKITITVITVYLTFSVFSVNFSLLDPAED